MLPIPTSTPLDLRRQAAGSPRAGRLLAFFVALTAFVALTGLLAVSPAFAAAQETASSSESDASSAVSPADTATAASEEGQADDEYEWHTDEEGKVYRVATLPKVERTYSKPRDGWVRFPGGATFPLLKESDDTFWVKVYKDGQFTPDYRTRPQRTQVEEQAIRARYDVQLEEVDRLRLEPFENGLPKKGQWRDGFDIADMNGDGHLDIVFGPARKSTPIPSIFLGDGQGNWKRWAEATFEPIGYDYGDVTVGDWNLDGHPDLALGVHLRGLLALVNDGKGNFRLASEGIDYDVPGSKKPLAAFSSKSLATYDWNGDGRPDILAQGEGPKRATGASGEVVQGSVGFRVFLNQEDGTWQAVQVSPADNRNFADDFTLYDFDRDGRDDVVTGTSQLGNRWVVLQRDSELGTSVAEFPGLPERGVIDALATGDFDKDGLQDLAVTYRASVLRDWRSGVDVFLRRDDSWERRPLVSLLQREPFRDLDVADVDGDGHLDIAALDDFGTLRLFLGKGKGDFVEEIVLEGPKARVGCQGYDVELRDLDGDGRPEIVAAFAGEAQGMAAFTGSKIHGCVDGGSLRAWKIAEGPSLVIEEGAAAESAPGTSPGT